jgi:YVTN family beta-propeller protein
MFLFAAYVGQPYLYVGNYHSGAGSVGVIDTTTNTVISTITATGHSNFDVVYCTANGYVYASEYNNSVGVIDTASNTIIATITVGSTPRGVAVSPDQQYVYSANAGSQTTQYVISTATNTVVATFPIDAAITPASGPSFIRSNGTYLYSVNTNGGNFNVIDPTTYAIVATIPTAPGAPGDIVFTPDGQSAYLINKTGQVNLLDLATNTITATVAGLQTPISAAITPNGKYLYTTANVTPGLVYKIDTATNTVLTTISVGPTPRGIVITSNGKLAYVANSFSPTSISVIDLSTDTVTATIAPGLYSEPLYLALTQVSPPNAPQGVQKKAVFLTKTDRINFISWQPASTIGPQPDSYSIYRDQALTQLVANVSASEPLTYADHNREKDVAYTYYIVSVTGDQSVSLPVILTVTP